MRALRMTLAGTVIVVLLGALSGAVLAQSEDAALPAFVTGNEECQLIEAATLIEEGPSVERWRGYVQECEDDMSDARVSGTYTNVANWDAYPDLDVFWGTHVLDGSTGGWDCSWAGTSDPTRDNVGLVFSVCPGTGEFEGLTYVFQHVWRATSAGVADGDFGDGTSMFGVIYEGPAPVTMAAAEESAE